MTWLKIMQTPVMFIQFEQNGHGNKYFFLHFVNVMEKLFRIRAYMHIKYQNWKLSAFIIGKNEF